LGLPASVNIGYDQLLEDQFGDSVQQRVTVCGVPVQGHRVAVQHLAQAPHRQRGQAVLVDQRQRGCQDDLAAQRASTSRRRDGGGGR